jgi:hypothetical protein
MQVYVVQYTAPGNEGSVIAGAAESFEAAVRLAQSVIPSEGTLEAFNPYENDSSVLSEGWSADYLDDAGAWVFPDAVVIVKTDVVQDQEGN